MHSYRHGFHAANHADVLKHAILVQILDYTMRKATAVHVIDTHAGAGLYDLGHDWSRQSGEAATGVQRLLQADGNTDSNTDKPPALVARYLDVLTQCRKQHGTQSYPGSPWLALHALRAADRLHLFETHPSEIQALRRLPGLRPEGSARQGRSEKPERKACAADRDGMQGSKSQQYRGYCENLQRGRPPETADARGAAGYSDLPQINLHQTDGFTATKALLPPVSRRGIVVMDPSYEDKQDYRRVMQALTHGLQRFATGCYLVWHPLVQRREAMEMIRRLRSLPDVAWLHATLQVKQAPRDGVGLYGSGVFIVNPPWTLRGELASALPWLRARLAQDAHARTALDHAP